MDGRTSLITRALEKRCITQQQARELFDQLHEDRNDLAEDPPDMPPPLSPFSEHNEESMNSEESDDEVRSDGHSESGFDTDPDENLDLFERVQSVTDPLPPHLANFVYAGRYLTGPNSKASVALDVELGHLVTGSCSHATPTGVFRLVDELSSKFEVNTSYFCGNCHYPLPNSHSACFCCGTAANRTLEFKPFGVATSSIILQLEDILRKNIDIFESETVPSDNDRSELHYWRPQKVDGIVQLHLLLNTDGVSPKQNFQGELNPIYIGIGNLPSRRRGLLSNIACASIITGRGKPHNEIWRHAVEDLEEQLAILKTDGLTVCGITFKLAHIDLVADIMAVTEIFSSVGHCSTDCGCLRCFVKPLRLGHASHWPTTRKADDRSFDSYFVDSVNYTNGLKGRTVWYNIQTPGHWRVDGLHTLDKGVILLFMNQKLKTLGQRTKWNKVFMDAKFPNCTVFRPRTLTQMKRFTANDNRTVYFTLMPIIWYATFDANPTQNAFSLLVWLCIRHMGSTYLTTDTIEVIANALEMAGREINDIFPNEFYQMKAHLTFVHAAHDLRTHGTPYDFTAAPFEAMNRVIKVKLHPYDTHSLTGSMLKNFLSYREWVYRAQVLLKDPTISPNFVRAVSKIMPKKRVKNRPYSPPQEGRLFDNSVVRFRNHGLQYGPLRKRTSIITHFRLYNIL